MASCIEELRTALEGKLRLKRINTALEAERDGFRGELELLHEHMKDENTKLTTALETAEAVYRHRHFCEECMPAMGCNEFYTLHSQAAAARVAVKEEVFSD